MAYQNLDSTAAGSGAVDSIFGRDGVVTAQTGDYSKEQITGLKTSDAPTFAGITISGAQKVNETTVNAATYDLLATDYILNVAYTTTGAVTSLTLPTAQCVAGRAIVIKDTGGLSGTNNITIDTEGSETIDGDETAVINSDYSSINLYSDGSNWFIY